MAVRSFDVIVLGAGAAGLMAALQAGRRGRKVALLEKSGRPGAKILVSGGGRCNFTNLGAGAGNYVSGNPHFCKSALARFTPADFLALVRGHGIPYHEKKAGQLFCDRAARDILDMLLAECGRAGVELFTSCEPLSVERRDGFVVETRSGAFRGQSLVVATGGLSFPRLGASDFGHALARRFGLKTVDTAPALDGFRLAPGDQETFRELSGVSCDAEVQCGKARFRESLLFTHLGLGGPAALQASLYWEAGREIRVNFLPAWDGPGLEKALEGAGPGGPRALLSRTLPRRLAAAAERLPRGRRGPSALAAWLRGLPLVPLGTVGYSRAEVTRGGVDTGELSSRSMESRRVPGLYFVGEVVDVTGWLGGYNFQWAWASGWAAGQEA